MVPYMILGFIGGVVVGMLITAYFTVSEWERKAKEHEERDDDDEV